MDFSTEALDAATAELILQLQLDDFHELHERWKGKQRADEAPGDFCTALEIYHVDLERIKTTFSDERMSRSMEQATVDDGDLVSEFASEEAVAVEDRELAVRLEAEDAHGELASSSELHDDVCNSQTSLKLRRPLHNSNDDDERNSVQAGPSTRWTSSQANRSKPARCAICMEDIPSTKETTRAPCGKHDYCLDCLADLVTRSLTDDSLFPPRCCAQPIPIRDDDWTRSLLGPALVEAFLARQLEMSTSDRTYCHEPGCSAFIEPASITDDVGVCPLCQELTCAVCKGAAHDGDCPEDVGVQEVLFLAQENNWQRCSSCRRVVELRSGCHHISEFYLLNLPFPQHPLLYSQLRLIVFEHALSWADDFTPLSSLCSLSLWS